MVETVTGKKELVSLLLDGLGNAYWVVLSESNEQLTVI